MSAMILYSLLLAFQFIKTQKFFTVISKELFQFIRECKCIVIAENVRYVLINLIRYLLNMFDVNTNHVENLLFREYQHSYSVRPTFLPYLCAYPIYFTAGDGRYLIFIATKQ